MNLSVSGAAREPFEKAYKVGPVLGKGGFGIVYAGVRNRDGLQVAIKHIAKAKIKDWGQVRHIIFRSLRQSYPGRNNISTYVYQLLVRFITFIRVLPRELL